jgi:hypothetical protein
VAAPSVSKLFLRRLLKVLHEISTAGIMGAAAIMLLLSFHGEGASPTRLAEIRAVVLLLSWWVLLPSLLVVLFSGLVALAIHGPFTRAPWALLKLAMTTLVFEVTIGVVHGSARGAARLAEALARGEAPLGSSMAGTYRMERWGIGILLLLSVVNIVLAVWRPRFKRERKAAAPGEATAEATGAEASTTGVEGAV